MALTNFFLNFKLWAASLAGPLSSFAQAAPDVCNKGSFLNFPTWYKYLTLNRTPDERGIVPCNPIINGLNDFWLIGLAVIEILLRVAILVAIIYVLIGGFKYITARGETGGGGGPNKINQARTTVIDALIGLVIAIIAIAGISFIAGKFTSA